MAIKNVAMSDLGAYKCVAKNSLGDTDGVIKLYRKYNTGSCWWGGRGCRNTFQGTQRNCLLSEFRDAVILDVMFDSEVVPRCILPLGGGYCVQVTEMTA